MRTLAITIAVLTVITVGFMTLGQREKYLSPIELSIFKEEKEVKALIEGYTSGEYVRYDITLMTPDEIVTVVIIDGELADYRKIASMEDLKDKLSERIRYGKSYN
jgi:hypothetical protein